MSYERSRNAFHENVSCSTVYKTKIYTTHANADINPECGTEHT